MSGINQTVNSGSSNGARQELRQSGALRKADILKSPTWMFRRRRRRVRRQTQTKGTRFSFDVVGRRPIGPTEKPWGGASVKKANDWRKFPPKRGRKDAGRNRRRFRPGRFRIRRRRKKVDHAANPADGTPPGLAAGSPGRPGSRFQDADGRTDAMVLTKRPGGSRQFSQPLGRIV